MTSGPRQTLRDLRAGSERSDLKTAGAPILSTDAPVRFATTAGEGGRDSGSEAGQDVRGGTPGAMDEDERTTGRPRPVPRVATRSAACSSAATASTPWWRRTSGPVKRSSSSRSMRSGARGRSVALRARDPRPAGAERQRARRAARLGRGRQPALPGAAAHRRRDPRVEAQVGAAVGRRGAPDRHRRRAARCSIAHDHGIVHRDVKPANVIVDGRRPGRTAVSLIDFGLARSARARRVAAGRAGRHRPLPRPRGRRPAVGERRRALGPVRRRRAAVRVPGRPAAVRRRHGRRGAAPAPATPRRRPLRGLGVDVPRGRRRGRAAAAGQGTGRAVPVGRRRRWPTSTAIADRARRRRRRTGRHRPACVDRRQPLTEPVVRRPRRRAGRASGACSTEPAGARAAWCWSRPSRAAARPASSTSWPSRRRRGHLGAAGPGRRPRPPSGPSRSSTAWSAAWSTATTPAAPDRAARATRRPRAGRPPACWRRCALPDLAARRHRPRRRRRPRGLRRDPQPRRPRRSSSTRSATPARPALSCSTTASGPTASPSGSWPLAATFGARGRAARARCVVVAAFRSEEVAAGHPLRAHRDGESLHLAPFGPTTRRPAGLDGRAAARRGGGDRRSGSPTAARSWRRPSCGAWSRPAR